MPMDSRLLHDLTRLLGTRGILHQPEDLLLYEYDGSVDVGRPDCVVFPRTAADVVVFITAGAVDHSVAEATVGWMIALTHHMRIKDMLVREGQWDEWR